MQPLAGHVGSWRGENAFRLMPDDPVALSDVTAQVVLAAGGHVAVLTYSWSHPDDGVQDGVLMLGPADPTEGERTAVWGDSWHQAPDPRDLAWSDGDGSDKAVTLGYDYTDDGWRWQIVLDLTDPEGLAVRMDNVPPETADMSTYPAMTITLHRRESV